MASIRLWRAMAFCLAVCPSFTLAQDTPWRDAHDRGARAFRQGRFPDAESHLTTAAAHAERFPARDGRLATTLDQLAWVCYKQARYERAEASARRALALREKAEGPDSSDVSESLGTLAACLAAQGRYAEAEPLFRRAVAIAEKKSSAEYPLLANNLHNLAELYRFQGRYAETEPLYRRSIALTQQTFGGEHPAVAASLHSLALVYHIQADYPQSERH